MKEETNIQEQLSDVVLFDEVFNNLPRFYEKFSHGTEVARKYLYETWNNIKEELKKDDNLIIKDLDKEVKPEDFDVAYNKTKNGIDIYTIVLPDPDYADAISKYVVVALTQNKPRYLTLKYGQYLFDAPPSWAFGEHVIEGNEKKYHMYDASDTSKKIDLTEFTNDIIKLFEEQII